MLELFSCRNCIHNAGQSLHIGAGQGFCIKHSSVIDAPADTTCKYQHRKDLPLFVVDEAKREHAAEFAGYTDLVSLSTMQRVQKIFYSEKYAWERQRFDPVLNALALYQRTERRWVFIQTFAGGVDGQRALVHGSLVRRYMDQCGHWTSSYRMILSVVAEMTTQPMFPQRALNVGPTEDPSETEAEARWDVFFARLCGIQEYGWHSGLEGLMWASDRLNGGLSTLDWEAVMSELEVACAEWTESIIRHANDNEAFFTQTAADEHANGEDVL